MAIKHVKKNRNKKKDPKKLFKAKANRKIEGYKDLQVVCDIQALSNYCETIGDRPLTREEHEQFYKGDFFPLYYQGYVDSAQLWTVDFEVELLSAYSVSKIGEFGFTIHCPVALTYTEFFQGKSDLYIIEDRVKTPWKGAARIFVEEIDNIDPQKLGYKDVTKDDIVIGGAIATAKCNAVVYAPRLFNTTYHF